MVLQCCGCSHKYAQNYYGCGFRCLIRQLRGSLQWAQVKGWPPKLVSSFHCLTKCEIWPQSPLLWLSFWIITKKGCSRMLSCLSDADIWKNIKCQPFISLSFKTFVWNFVIISIWILELRQKKKNSLGGQSDIDFDPIGFNQLIHGSCQLLSYSSKVFWRNCCHGYPNKP